MHIIQKLDRNAYRNMCEYNRITGMCCYLLTDRRTESTYPTDRSLQRSIASPPRCSVCSQSIAASSRALGQLCLAETAVLPSSFILLITCPMLPCYLLRGEVYVTVGPTPRSKHESFSNIGRVRRLREICPNFE